MVVYLVAFSLTFVYFIYCHVRHKLRYATRNALLDKLGKAPIRNLPFVGQTWYFLKPGKKIIKTLEDLLSKSDRPFVLWLSSYLPIVHLTRAEDIEKLASRSTNRELLGMTDGTLNYAISMQNHEMWSKTRRLLDPAFGTIMLSQYLKVFDKHSKILVDMLEPKASAGKIFNLHRFITYTNFNLLQETLTGVNLDKREMDEINEYYETSERVVKLLYTRVANPLLWMNFTLDIYKRLIGMDKKMKKLDDFVNEAIREAKKITTENPEGGSKRRLLIDLLLSAHNSDPKWMSEKRIRDEILLFTAATNEICTGTGLLILMFGMHQDAQEIVYQEILSTISDERQQTTMDNINQLPYLEQCVKETLRLFTIVPASNRQPLTDTTLPSGETIPADTFVMFHYKNVHENAVLYPNPRSWNPNNFSPEAMKNRPQGSFAAFGFGSRMCIGYRFAMLAMKVQAIHILRRYRVHTNLSLNEMVFDRDFVLRYQNGYLVRLEARSPETLTVL